MKDLFGVEQHEAKLIKNKSGSFNFNPCIPVYGNGPENTKCKACKYFIRKHYDKVYFKCKFRGSNNSPSTDHRANWPTCGKYEEDNE